MIKVIILVVVAVLIYQVFVFAGVQPIPAYKNGDLSFSSSNANNSSQPPSSSSNPTPPEPKPASVQPTTHTAITPGAASAIDRSAFQAIDQYALATPESAAKSLDTLAAYLVKPAKTDFEKARAIYRWITQNISYDFSAYLNKAKGYGSIHAVDVLTSRSSVCAGYSGLFYYLARSARLEVVSISGWAKGYSYNVGDQINGPVNHAWNAIKINGGWYLIDSTWGAGHIEEQRFVREFDEAYFLTPPDQFIYNHLPEDSKWQLLNKPLTQNDFSALPYVNQNFFKYGLNLGDNTQSIINTKDSLSMKFPVPSNTYLMAGLSLGDNELDKSFATARRVGNQYQINTTFPYPGTYVLSIFARKNDEYSGLYSGVLEYKIISGSTLQTKQTTPNQIVNPSEESASDIPDDSYVQVSNDAYYYEGTSGEYCTYVISVHNKHETWSLRNVRLILETGNEYDIADLVKPYDTVTFNRNKLLCSKFKATWIWQPPPESK